MKFSTSYIAVFAAVFPTVWSLPTAPSARQFKPPTCGAEQCLAATNGEFDACKPNDLACLCRLEQSEVTRYVETVQPCINGDIVPKSCTAGAIYQYKDLLKTVCASKESGNKIVAFQAAA